MPGEKIKVAIITDNVQVSEWIFLMLSKVKAIENVSVCCIILDKTSKNKKKPGWLQQKVFEVLVKFEKKPGKTSLQALHKRNFSKLFPHLNFIDGSAFRGNNADPQKLLATLPARIDVLIDLTGEADVNRLPLTPTHGTWRYTFGRNSKWQIPGIYEIINNVCYTEIGLSSTAPGLSSSNFLVRSFSSTNNLSFSKNINAACFKAASFIPRKLEELYQTGNVGYEKEYNDDVASDIHTPANGITLYSLKHFTGIVSKKLNKRSFFEQWRIMYHTNAREVNQQSIKEFKSIIPPRNVFWADPCLFVNEEGRQFIFFEEYPYKTKIAHISVIELYEDGTFSQPGVVLQKPYHLSYPFIFKAEGKLYMIPETSGNRTIELYSCVDFPNKWQFEMNLMENIHAVDATMHIHNNKFWLFVNLKENAGASAWDELFVFYSDKLMTTNWQSHPKNPVISDVRRARPAGGLFYKNNRLYRPSQDSSCTYGYAININEVVNLDERDYTEKKVTTVLPGWNNDVTATHTLSVVNNMAVIDARYKIRR